MPSIWFLLLPLFILSTPDLQNEADESFLTEGKVCTAMFISYEISLETFIDFSGILYMMFVFIF